VTPTRTTSCPLCDGDAPLAFETTDRNHAVASGVFRYHRCSRCGTVFLADPPSDLGAAYPDEYFTLPSLPELRAAAAEERYRSDIVRRHSAGGRLVEIGPGNGIFAVQAVDAGFETAAIEMDPVASAYLRETLGIEVVESGRPERELRRMPPSDVIAAWHVIEHVPAPWELLEAAAANLAPGGVLVIATPNPGALGLRVLGARWPHVDAPRHLFLIPHETLTARARELGLELVELTDTDTGGRHWNAFAWQFALRRPGASYVRERLAAYAGRAIARALAPVERSGLRGAAYTAVLRKP
jgi:2-polyprenyl-3-methyl-5-hydroxy-6-metoxy-1,4-benzoquinol methylase